MQKVHPVSRGRTGTARRQGHGSYAGAQCGLWVCPPSGRVCEDADRCAGWSILARGRASGTGKIRAGLAGARVRWASWLGMHRWRVNGAAVAGCALAFEPASCAMLPVNLSEPVVQAPPNRRRARASFATARLYLAVVSLAGRALQVRSGGASALVARLRKVASSPLLHHSNGPDT